MYLKSIVVLGLLPGLLAASAVRRGVTCSFSTAASDGDTCASFSATWGVTVDTFMSLNPGVNCPNLVAGHDYCVIGSVKSGSPPTKTTHKATTKPHPKTTTKPNPHSPTQAGLAKNCDQFHLVQSGDQCGTIEKKFKISPAEFNKWNPSIDAKCDNLFLDYYVCVHTPGAAVATPKPKPKGPQPQMPGIVSNCKKFHLVKSGDSCYTIDLAAGISLAQFRSWNKKVDAACDNMWLAYYVCIGV